MSISGSESPDPVLSSARYSSKSPGWQLRISQILLSVSKRTPRTLPDLSNDTFCSVIPIRSASSFERILRLASITSRFTIMLMDRHTVLAFASAICTAALNTCPIASTNGEPDALHPGGGVARENAPAEIALEQPPDAVRNRRAGNPGGDVPRNPRRPAKK